MRERKEKYSPKKRDRKKNLQKKEEKNIPVVNKEKLIEQKREKEENNEQELNESGDSSFEFISISEAKKKPLKKVSLEEEVFFQNEQLSELDSLPSSVKKDEERKSFSDNPYFSPKENLYSTKKEEREYSSSTGMIRPIIKREQIEIRSVQLSSPLTTLSIAPIQRELSLIRMPNQEETYQQKAHKTYELERVSPDDLSRKTWEHREIEIKYDID